MAKKLTIQHFQQLCESRNHVLVNVSNQETPNKGKMTVHCNTCNTNFTTSAHSYKNARQTGCPQCKSNKMAKENPVVFRYANETLEQKEAAKKYYASLKRLQKRERAKKASKLPRILDLNQFKDYLNKENNAYTKFILEKLEQKLEKKPGFYTETHHILPRPNYFN